MTLTPPTLLAEQPLPLDYVHDFPEWEPLGPPRPQHDWGAHGPLMRPAMGPSSGITARRCWRGLNNPSVGCDLVVEARRGQGTGLPPWGEGLDLTCPGGQVIYSRGQAWVVIAQPGTYTVTATHGGEVVWSITFTV